MANLRDEIFKGFSKEDSQFIQVPRVFIEMTGNASAAIVLSKLLYWQGTKPGEEFYKTDSDLAAECCISVRQATRIRVNLVDLKIGVHFECKGDRNKTHYRVDTDELSAAIAKHLGMGNGQPTGQNVVTEEETQPGSSDNMSSQLRQNDVTSCYSNVVTPSIYKEEDKEKTKNHCRAEREPNTLKESKTPAKYNETPATQEPHPAKQSELWEGLSYTTPGAQQPDPAQRLKDAFNLMLRTLQVSERSGFTKQDDKKIKDILPLYDEDIHRLDDYAVWIAENWDAMRLTDDTLKTLEAPSLNFFTSSHYFDKYFMKFATGKRVSPGSDMNAIANARYRQERSQVTESAINEDYEDETATYRPSTNRYASATRT